MLKIKTKLFPQAPSLRQLIGPSFILVGLGLGSGEIILWPYLTSNFGLGIIWAAVLGITFQFFMNMEIERYALVKGESVFVGFNRMWRHWPTWFIISSFLGFGWPGMSAASAQLIGRAFGINTNTHYIAIALLFLTGFLFTIGPVLYKMVERFEKLIIFICVPFLTFLAFYFAHSSDWLALGQGLLGQGAGYNFVPQGIAMAVLLSAFAYSGAGGNLNLSQSLYIKDKGYGLGAYAKRITSLVAGKERGIHTATSQVRFENNQENFQRFRVWWRRINVEHLLIFWATGAFTMLMLSLLSFSLTRNGQSLSEGINFIFYEASIISSQTLPWLGTAFLLVGGIMLLSTQIGVYESCSRIITENLAIRAEDQGRGINISKTFYIVLWSFVGFGTLVLLSGFNQPKTLIVLGAVINAFAMLVHLILTYILNRRELPHEYQASWWRQGIILMEIVFFLVFTGIVFWDKVI